ncbi:MAG TPA: S8 family serine peptidase [Pirellulaceae bacterium]|nr:S8 family serine peptidase [Pirellulaceae bacterium]
MNGNSGGLSRWCLAGALLLATQTVQGQGLERATGRGEKRIVQADVDEQVARLKAGEFLRIIIRLQSQFPREARVVMMAGKDRQQRAMARQALVKAQRDHAHRLQRPVMEQLRKLEAKGLVKNVRPLWIANVVAAEATREAIEEIARLDGIEYIKQDVKRPALQAPAWGVSQINADDVWAAPGLTGTGVVVAVLDTGMDLAHSDLVNRLWINPGEDNGDGQFTAADNDGVDNDGNGYVDDVVGWDFQNADNEPTDWHGHGTHVAGSIAGDGTGGTATGVAPGARLMVLAYSASLTMGQAEAWEGMQYALQNGADIVSFSSGWKDAWSPDYQTWRDNSNVLADAGVLFVVAAGNDGPHVPAPGDVLTPARAPRVLAVGATDSADVIAGFSGQGPTSWQGVAGYNDYIHPPGLLKPDVSAPGVSVNSTANGGGYVNGPTWSGTSMATPHVSGVAALLLQQDPTLLPHELTYIIRETAVDLGAAGPDNAYGYGRVDALAAVNHAYAKSPPYDLSVTGTNAVWTSVDIWVDNNDDGIPDDPVANTNNHLYARVRNIGGQAVGNVEIKFFYADVGTIGIGGFDPNDDGDPSDGDFNYIDSYFVPVVGPAGSSQDTAVGVVNWNVPVPVTDHWCVGIGIVAPNPPNATEVVRVNNRAFRNFFNIIVTYNQVAAFKFFVYPEMRRPKEPFDLEFVRRGLPKEYEVELAVEKGLADKWFAEARGFERMEHRGFKNLPVNEELALQQGEPILSYARLAGDRGLLHGIAVPDGKPVLITAVLRAPGREVAEKLGKPSEEQLLVINAANGKGAFGGLTLNVKLDPGNGRARGGGGDEIGKKLRPYRVQVEDAAEAALIQQQLKLVPVQVRDRWFYYQGDERLNARLKELGYEPQAVDPKEIQVQFFRLEGIEGEEGKRALADIGARVLIREPKYWIVRATTGQQQLLKRLNYRLVDLGPQGPRPRQIRILVDKLEETTKIAPLLADLYSEEPSGKQFALHGAAWDDMIDELKARGYTVEPVKEKE